jgi:hypothetical protein
MLLVSLEDFNRHYLIIAVERSNVRKLTILLNTSEALCRRDTVAEIE